MPVPEVHKCAEIANEFSLCSIESTIILNAFWARLFPLDALLQAPAVSPRTECAETAYEPNCIVHDPFCLGDFLLAIEVTNVYVRLKVQAVKPGHLQACKHMFLIGACLFLDLRPRLGLEPGF